MSIGKDKFYHAIACFIITVGTFIGLVITLKAWKKFFPRRCLHLEETSSNEEATNDDPFNHDVSTTAAADTGSNNNDNHDEGGEKNIPDLKVPLNNYSPNIQIPFSNDDDDENDHAASESSISRKTCIKVSIPRKFYFLAGISGIIALLIGVIKEIGDHYNIWFLCKRVDENGNIVGCESSWSDIFADVIGILIGEVIVLGGLAIWFRFRKR